MKVLVADDDPLARRLVEAWLRRAEYEPVLASNGVDVLRILRAPDSPRLVVLDWKMPGLDGLDVCRAIRASQQEPYVYVLLLTANERRADIVEGLDAGADDYLSKPCDIDELHARLRTAVRLLQRQDQLVTSRDALREQATHDPLTGLLNRGAVLDVFEKECERARRHKDDVGVILIDVDHFKAINDTYGHLVGDGVLREIASRLHTSLRPYDAIGRFGGEEFLVVAPGCNHAAAAELAMRLRRCVADTDIACGEHRLTVTISLGVASGAAGATAHVLQHADDALYRAKANGRNRLDVHVGAPAARRN